MFSFSDADYYQITPLHLAASTGNTDVLQYLLRADVSFYLTYIYIHFSQCPVEEKIPGSEMKGLLILFSPKTPDTVTAVLLNLQYVLLNVHDPWGH